MARENEEPSVKIYFSCPDMDLREISIVSEGLHRTFNEAFAQGLEYHRIYGRQQFFRKNDDPLLVSLVVTELAHGSLSARTKVRLLRGVRDLGIGTVASLVASAVIAIGVAAQRHADVQIVQPESPSLAPAVDVGPHIRDMAKQLAASDKSWELTVEDEDSGTRVFIRSGPSLIDEPEPLTR